MCCIDPDMSRPCNEVYVCNDCLASFLMKGNFAIHSKQTGHKDMNTLKIDAAFNLGDKDYLLLELA